MRHAKAMVHMAISEGFCNAVHEAMSQGVPCIVSKGTALEELISDGTNGYCVISDDVSGVAEKIGTIIDPEHHSAVKKMGSRNIAAVAVS